MFFGGSCKRLPAHVDAQNLTLEQINSLVHATVGHGRITSTFGLRHKRGGITVSLNPGVYMGQFVTRSRI